MADFGLGFEESENQVPGWNYSRPEDDSYSASICGDIVEINLIQAWDRWTDPEAPKPLYWTKDGKKTTDFAASTGKPITNWQFIIHDVNDNEWGFAFAPTSSREKDCKSFMDELVDALEKAGIDHGKKKKIGKAVAGINISITTEEEATDSRGRKIKYGVGNPRPWHVMINGKGKSEFRGFTNKAQEFVDKMVADAAKTAAVSNQDLIAEVAKSNPALAEAQQRALNASAGVYADEDIPF